MKMTCSRAIVALCLSWLFCSELHAAVIYSNLGAGDSFIINREYDVNSNFMATPFVTSDGGNLADIRTPLFSLNDPVTLGLYTDSSGIPGTLLESWSAIVPGIPGQLVTLASVQNPLLSADTQYWFVVTVTQAQRLNLAWYQNSQGFLGGIFESNDFKHWLQFVPDSPAPAIELTSIASVPEPRASMLLAGGLLILTVSCA
jgi:hypothetical protein